MGSSGSSGDESDIFSQFIGGNRGGMRFQTSAGNMF